LYEYVKSTYTELSQIFLSQLGNAVWWLYFSIENLAIQYLLNRKSSIMKRRVRKIANFFAFNLLFFALYLNFVHQDKIVAGVSDQNKAAATAAFSGTVLVDHPDEYAPKTAAAANNASRSTAGN
jgi:hypothetical protein